MHVLHSAQLVFLRGRDCKTYRPPVRNKAQSSIFSVRGSCSFLIKGIGARRMAKSVITQGIGIITVNIASFPHRA